MQKGNSERVQILKGLEKIKNTPSEMESQKQLMLFLSFDITDSTKLKLRYPKEWANVIHILLSSKFQPMEVWKFNGDEVLYKRNVTSLEFILKILAQAYKFMESLQKQMKVHINEISVKSTIWLAVTEQDLNEYRYNYSFKFEEFNDFVGKSIDEGFRLTKCSSMQKIACDPKLVYIVLDAYEYLKHGVTGFSDSRFCRSVSSCDKSEMLKQIGELLKNLHLVGYAKCKGVWDNNPYPIYWYYSNSSGNGIHYSEYLNGEHLWQKETIHPLFEDSRGYQPALENIRSIFEQMQIVPEIEEIYDILELDGEIAVSSEGKANLYFMVACVNPKTNKVLIAKRSPTRKHLKNVWDFGNVKYQNVKMKGIIEKDYKNTFGIDIKLFTDAERMDYIKPYGYCTIYRNSRAHNGILCYALIDNPKDLSEEELIDYINNYKADIYSEVRFVDEKDVSGFRELTLDDIIEDSKSAENGSNEPYTENCGIMFFRNSIENAIAEYKKKFNV